MPLLSIGGKAPAFEATDQDGEAVTLRDFRGSNVILYFYPKDDTPGCTKEACSFRDVWARFRRRKIAVLGVSVDDARSHRESKVSADAKHASSRFAPPNSTTT